MTEEIKRTSAEWLRQPKYTGYLVLDPDGWDRKNYRESWNELITEAEFEKRFSESTVLLPRINNAT